MASGLYLPALPEGRGWGAPALGGAPAGSAPTQGTPAPVKLPGGEERAEITTPLSGKESLSEEGTLFPF